MGSAKDTSPKEAASKPSDDSEDELIVPSSVRSLDRAEDPDNLAARGTDELVRFHRKKRRRKRLRAAGITLLVLLVVAGLVAAVGYLMGIHTLDDLLDRLPKQ